MFVQELRPARRQAPTVELLETPEGLAVRKSYRNCSLMVREVVGRLAIHRECWALRELEGCHHAPTLWSRPDRYSMICEYIEGTPLEHLSPTQVDPARLEQQAHSLLEALTKAGLAHGDLGHDHWQEMGRECNLIWTPDQRLVAIDFAGAVPLQAPLNLGQALHRHDRLLATKISHHFRPEHMRRSEGVDWPLGLWELLRMLGKV
jgi:RIO-like serine/threonine protein kinase